MNKREAERLTRQMDTLQALGFTRDEAEALRRISMTLHCWHERECGTDGGCIERDETTGKPYWVSEWGGQWSTGKRCRTAIRDLEAGAHKRLAAIIARRNARITDDHSKDAEQYIHAACAAKLSGIVSAYVQTDPRGAALYIIRPGDVPDGCDVNGFYSRGVCVY